MLNMARHTSSLVSLLCLSSVFSPAQAGSLEKRDLEAPQELEGGWEYQGCYVDVPGRTINRAATHDFDEMTNQMCADYCAEHDYAYAGTEYYYECYCGNVLAEGGIEAKDAADCNTPCTGDEDQACGGGDRLTLYKRPVQGPVENPGPKNWPTIGCYTEGNGGRALGFQYHGVPASEMTVAKCTKGCQDNNYKLAGVEYGGECFCGNDFLNSAKPALSGCEMKCNGNKTEVCGGPDRLNVYDFKEDWSEDHSTTTSSVIPPSDFTFISESTEASDAGSTTVPSSESTASTDSDDFEAQETTTTPSTTPTPTPSSTTSSATSSSADEEEDDETSTQESTSTPSSAPTPTPTPSSESTASTPTPTSTPSSESTTSTPTPTSTPSSESTTSTPTPTPSSEPESTSTPASTPTPSPSSESTSTPVSTPTPTPSSESTTSTPTPTPSSESTTTTPTEEDEETTTTTSTTAKPTSTECPHQPEEALGGWEYYGCFTEATGMRALSARASAGPDMTIEKCAEFCTGFTYFGMEYSAECFCGNTLNRGSIEAPQAQCNMVCSGNECNYCGGPDRLSVYARTGAPPPPSQTLPNEPSETSKAPVPTDLPEGWGYYGCWIDAIQGRVLNFQLGDDPDLTSASCASACEERGYTVAGTQYFTQCFCGHALVNGATEASESECNTPCGGNEAEMCGGPNRLSVFSTSEPSVFGPPAPVPEVGDWTYQGCATDAVGAGRVLPWQLLFENTLTPKICLDACAEYGYMAAGLEYGVECYCGDPIDLTENKSEFVSEAQCANPCAGNGTNICGGPARLSVYFWEGDPFYTFAYPEDGTPEAGSYDHLIGGVVIPLMTSETILGKVTFLEKWTTGPPNSTGAYELDLTQINNFEQAWRTMSVRTDLFCAAGVTLPDKAGRQLTVGGWSGDSTYGVRLYTPDGGPGVKGTNDWEEDVDVLSLQHGRWYPSTLNMANGSILVVGGEEGSNGAPVPTIEVLPFTGTAPLYMEWLERTDPNNLYPFLAVLPSGGIFVTYWNEARILDESTLETIRTLPNMPGAVNDPLGGRTYPLEGTSVILPQKAPFTAPLEVLVCGGSTEGIMNALDNCVSIEPDVPGAEWTIERMPSKRVMSCMAPLPDGTFLIVNGAKAGNAGFGLATKPNLNAVLYDPSKAKGSRMTVMANTTVARMYHSESITLLDGTVLISGSDPQDGVNPQEYRVETFTPPYLLTGKPRPTFTLNDKDWEYNGAYTFNLGQGAQNGAITVTLLGSVSSTHGNSMGARTLMPQVSCSGTSCTVTAPPRRHVCPPGWYQFFVLDGGIPAIGVYVRIGGDPAEIGNWPDAEGFTRPGM